MEKAILDHAMIESGDRILVGVSGGPDSLALLKLLHERLVYVKNDFSIFVLHIDLGFEEAKPKSWSRLESYFQKLDVEYRIVHTDIASRALDPAARKNPCFICSLQRRRAVYETAHEQGCNKIAYGHHKDDIVETLLINILYGRKIEAMCPVQEIFRGKMHIIRPLTYVEENLLKKFAGEADLPVLPRLCPADGNTRRQCVKEIISGLQGSEKNANIRENIFKSLHHVKITSDAFARKCDKKFT
jgi:tRNA 2-thiocytidine biosynthesis protein TtcA